METKPLRTRGIALEETYFRQIEAEQIRRSLEQKGLKALREDLGERLEIREGDLLDLLIEQGITPDTAAAFEALPLVEVAWADGEVDHEERWRVLATATALGLELGRPDHAQLELWLKRRPPQELFDAWYRFAEGRHAIPEARSRARRVIEGIHEVAAAAGGLLGFGAVCGAEREAIARIRQVLGDSPADPSRGIPS